eukprot:4453008-Pyramimonas_sp.AAC.2
MRSGCRAVERPKVDDKGVKVDDKGAKVDDKGVKVDDKGVKVDDKGAKADNKGAKVDDKGARRVPNGDTCLGQEDELVVLRIGQCGVQQLHLCTHHAKRPPHHLRWRHT